MTGFGFGFGSHRNSSARFLALNQSNPPQRATSVTQYGMTFTFSEERPVARYPTGDWRVLGPVTITSITPGAKQVSGTFIQGGTYPLSWINGTQVNPGNRSLATGGLAVNNKDNQPQGLNGIASTTNYSGTAYNHAFNQDPGATGQPLVVATGSVMKFASLVPPHESTRPGGSDMAVLTVVDDLGPDNALRPGVAQSDKTHLFTQDDFDLTVFKNHPRPASAPSAAQAIANVQRAYACQFTDSVNSENAHAINNHPNYGRDLANAAYTSALCLHLDYTAAEKLAILNGIYGIAIDWFERLREGGECVVPAGGGNQWKKCMLVIVTAALHGAANTAARDALRAMCDAQRNFLMAEDKQIREVNEGIIATPRNGGAGREKDEYLAWMEGTLDFAEGARGTGDYGAGGPNWDAPYRNTFCSPAIGGILAVLLTTGGKALWNRDEVFEYFRSYYAKALERGQVGNPGDVNWIIPFVGDMLDAHWPADRVAPAIVEAKVKDDLLWVRFDKAMDFEAVVPFSDYTVKINGAPVASLAYGPWVLGQSPTTSPNMRYLNGIFHTNVGFQLPAPVVASDVVTLSYAGGAGANKLRSAIDRVNVAAFADRAIQNVTPSIGGVNASYPIVRFDGTKPDRYKVLAAAAIATNAPRFTLWLPHIKIDALPTADVELFGLSGASPVLEIIIKTDGKLRVLPRSTSGIFAQLVIAPPGFTGLQPGTAYSLRVDVDAEQTTAAAGWSAYLNGVSSKSSNIGWNGAAGQVIAWGNSQNYQLGGTASPNFTGEFGGMWLHTSERVTDPAKVAKFTSLTGGSLDIGTLGDGITGTPPAIFIVGTKAQYDDAAGINRGTGPKFYRNTGGVVDVSGATWR